ncbi:MAG: DNA topoisomerase VI subunit B [Candidatus Aenigmatarchaeota archaeon]|nr:MAG: DNA topoisomerase VI subunit B [Candidatus Aenigmarchaeota archaeon]
MRAEDFARQQREISISEFFEKNRHLLGYDNKTKALLMIVKEGVDNALDATEEAGILPEIYVRVKEVGNEKYEIIIKDNGPGIIKKQIPRIFGKLLYGSKFHRLKQNRGQQGIGISAATLYTQLTTGEPLEIVSSTGDGKIHKYRIKINVRKNEPLIIESGAEEGVEWRGTQLRFLTEGLYREYRQSIPEYVKQTAIANPHAHIIFDSPGGRTEFNRGADSNPKHPKEIRPHLHGVELGILARMLRETKSRTLVSFLTTEFTKVGRKTAKEICSKAEIPETRKPISIKDGEARRLIEVVKTTKLLKPPTDCLSPLGNDMVKEGMKKELNPEWVYSITRPPEVYRGWPFQVEVGLAYGGSIGEAKVMRFANRVPLLYQQGDCAITKSVTGIDWRRYKLNGKGIPEEPLAIFVHLVSVWVPFTSESKEAIASYPVIIKEIKLAVQECARKLGLYLSGKRRHEYRQQRIRTFEKYAEETIRAISELSEEEKERVKREFLELINSNNNISMEDEDGGEKEAEGPREERSQPGREEGEPEDRAARQVTLERLLRREKRPDTDG